jgi:hypothetical protein
MIRHKSVWFLVAVFAVVGLGFIATAAEAGFPHKPRRPVVAVGTPGPVPNLQVRPALSMQKSYNRQVRRYLYSTVPPYLRYYNPYFPGVYTNPAYTYSTVTVYPAANPYGPYAGLYNPYLYGNYVNPALLAPYAYLYE